MIPMVKIEGTPDQTQVKPGMAFFSGTGPTDRCCGECKFRGYTRQSQKEHWNETLKEFFFKRYRVQACQLFKKQAGHHGPAVDKNWQACKFFEQKPKK